MVAAAPSTVVIKHLLAGRTSPPHILAIADSFGRVVPPFVALGLSAPT